MILYKTHHQYPNDCLEVDISMILVGQLWREENHSRDAPKAIAHIIYRAKFDLFWPSIYDAPVLRERLPFVVVRLAIITKIDDNEWSSRTFGVR